MLSGTPMKGSAKKITTSNPTKSDDKPVGFSSAFKTLLNEFLKVDCDYSQIKEGMRKS